MGDQPVGWRSLTNGTSGQVLTSNGSGGFGGPLTVGTDLLCSWQRTSAGYIDVYPPNDTTHPVGWQAPAIRSTQVRLVLPSADQPDRFSLRDSEWQSSSVHVYVDDDSGDLMTYPSGTGIAAGIRRRILGHYVERRNDGW